MARLMSWFDRYDDAARKNLGRWRNAINKIDADAYTTDDAFKDLMYVWLQSTLGVWGLLDAGKSIVAFDISKSHDDTATEKTEVIETPTGTDPKSGDLARTSGDQGDTSIKAAIVTCTLGADRTTLTVDLNGLKALDLRSGNVYEGEVNVGATKIADIYVTVYP